VKHPDPRLTPGFEPYWEGTAAGELRLQACSSCGHRQWFPGPVCRRCANPDLRWQAARGDGVLYSFSVIHRAPSAAMGSEAPYVLALVELSEGPRVMCNLVGCAPEAVHVGMPVHLEFEESMTGVARVPVCRPTKGGVAIGI
jgi:uncharacterized OB-fold protein